jgi:uncharacterized protein
MMSEQRFDAIDLARGIALLGVALVNVHAVARGWQSHYALDLAAHWGDVLAEYFVGLVFSHRSFPMLAFLFGAGIAMQWSRMKTSSEDHLGNANARSTLRWRYTVLFCLGIAHGLLLWPGDIVSTYALVALVLLWHWPKRDRRLKIWAIILSSIALLVYAVIAVVLMFDTEGFAPPFGEKTSFAQTTMVAALAMRPKELLANGITQAMLPEVWVAILIGVWCGQTGALERWLRGESNATRWFVFGFACLIVGTALEIYGSTRGGWSYGPTGSYGFAAMVIALPLTTTGSVFAWFMLARAWRASVMPQLRSFFIAAGRAPLTQFFGQSIVFTIVFSDSLIGWHGEMGRAAYSLTALVTFLLLAGFARAWLASGYARGPMEMVWMRLADMRAGARK